MKYKVGIALVILLGLNFAVARVTNDEWFYRPKPVEFSVERPQLVESFEPLVDNVVLAVVDGARYDIAMQIVRERQGLFYEGYSNGAWFENSKTVIPSLSWPSRASVITATKPTFHGIVANEMEQLQISNMLQIGQEKDLNQTLIAEDSMYDAAADWVPGIAPYWKSGDKGLHGLLTHFIEDNSSHFPDLLFYTYVETDDVGHKTGVSSTYYESVRNASIYLEEDYEEMLSQGLDDTIFIVFSDHGHTDIGGHGCSEPEVMHNIFFMYGNSVNKGRYNQSVGIQQIGATASYILGIELPLYTDLPPIFDAIEAPESRKAAYMLYYADLKTRQVDGFAASIGQSGKFQKDIAELNDALQDAYDMYDKENYSQAYVLSQQVGTKAYSMFEELENTMIEKAIVVRSLWIALLAIATTTMVVLVARRYKILKQAAAGLGALLIYYTIYLGLSYASGFGLSMSKLNIDRPAIAILLFLPLVISILFGPFGVYFLLKKMNLSYKDFPLVTGFLAIYNLVIVASFALWSGAILGQPVFSVELVLATLIFGYMMCIAIGLAPLYYILFAKVLSRKEKPTKVAK